MTARTVYEAAILAAASAKTATLTSNETTKQTTIDGAKSIVGYTTQTGNYANLAAAVKAANQAKWDADFLAEQQKQQAVMQARDALRASGDRSPV
jgi:hypothetical protein